jgi:hypothetical protein
MTKSNIAPTRWHCKAYLVYSLSSHRSIGNKDCA